MHVFATGRLRELGFDDVPLVREKPRVTGLQAKDLPSGGTEDGKIVGGNDAMAADDVSERPVWRRKGDPVSRAKAVDLREGREIRGAMPGDVNELVLAREGGPIGLGRRRSPRRASGGQYGEQPGVPEAESNAADNASKRA